MADFKGYLLKAVKTGEVFPHELIAYESYSSTPNQREEIKAYRDDNTRNLTRVTAKGRKTSIEFTSKQELTLAEKKKIQKWFTNGESNSAQRKIEIEYWNDEDNDYKTGEFYRPDIVFQIRKISNSKIWYNAITISLVEY